MDDNERMVEQVVEKILDRRVGTNLMCSVTLNKGHAFLEEQEKITTLAGTKYGSGAVQ